MYLRSSNSNPNRIQSYIEFIVRNKLKNWCQNFIILINSPLYQSY